jgi:hypothetical protein
VGFLPASYARILTIQDVAVRFVGSFGGVPASAGRWKISGKGLIEFLGPRAAAQPDRW